VAPVGPLGGWEIGGKVSKVCFNFQHGGDAKPFGFLYRVGYDRVGYARRGCTPSGCVTH
jgi:hypothetical protein